VFSLLFVGVITYSLLVLLPTKPLNYSLLVLLPTKPLNYSLLVLSPTKPLNHLLFVTTNKACYYLLVFSLLFVGVITNKTFELTLCWCYHQQNL
jgi:hypothetical protein